MLYSLKRKPKSWKTLADRSVAYALVIFSTSVLFVAMTPVKLQKNQDVPRQQIKKKDLNEADVYLYKPPVKTKYHPPHVIKVWTLRHRGRTFRCVQLPRCEHIEAVLSYSPNGATMAQAKARHNGIAVCTAGFIHSTSYALADFMQENGRRLSKAGTGRWMFVIYDTGKLDISANYMFIKGRKGITAAALGQRLVPLHKDGFSTAFMNKQTDRMGIGLTKHHIFIAGGKSDIWRFSKLFSEVLHCQIAVNTDGGHVVRGKSSTHIVFRWRNKKK